MKSFTISVCIVTWICFSGHCMVQSQFLMVFCLKILIAVQDIHEFWETVLMGQAASLLALNWWVPVMSDECFLLGVLLGLSPSVTGLQMLP